MDALKRAIAKTPEAAIAGVETAIAASTFAVTRRAIANAKEDTGLLKRSIKGKATKLNGRVTIDGAAFYWRFIEYGTVRIPARPFIRPSVEAEVEPHEQRIRAVATKLERDFSAGRFD